VLAPLFDERPFHVLTVTEVTRDIKELLEDTFASVWVEGEISNWRVVQSGHAYFTLKDAQTQLRTVMFRSALRQLPFDPEAGMHVLARGRLTVYEPRGDYQLLAETLEPKGVGALQVAFEQLKERLFQEGLFDETRKRPLPLVPQRIGIVTSPTGAAIRDIIQVVHRRRANVHLYLYPAHVQGKEAVSDIVQGIAASEIPVISAVGHEIDYTIADFVADLRAPTPSVAAELVVKSEEELRQPLQTLLARMQTVTQHTLRHAHTALEHLMTCRVLREPQRLVEARQQYVDDLLLQLEKGWQNGVQERTRRAHQAARTLTRLNPRLRWQRLGTHLHTLHHRLETAMRAHLTLSREQLNGLGSTLNSLSPLAVLGRGYSICRDPVTRRLATSTAAIHPGQQVEVLLSDGQLTCTVDAIHERESDGGRFDLRASLEALRGNRRGPGNGRP